MALIKSPRDDALRSVLINHRPNEKWGRLTAQRFFAPPFVGAASRCSASVQFPRPNSLPLLPISLLIPQLAECHSSALFFFLFLPFKGPGCKMWLNLGFHLGKSSTF